MDVDGSALLEDEDNVVVVQEEFAEHLNERDVEVEESHENEILGIEENNDVVNENYEDELMEEVISNDHDDEKTLPVESTSEEKLPTEMSGSKGLDDDEGQTCIICFEPWGNSGNHRLASLKCGHIFGSSCIEKWLKGQNGKCPQCNAKAYKKDIRFLYAKALKALDTSEKVQLQCELEKERKDKYKLQAECAHIKLGYELQCQKVKKLQEELQILKESMSDQNQVRSFNSSIISNQLINLQLFKLLEIMKDGGCRVMCHNEWLNMLVISLPSQVSIFPGYGIKKVSTIDLSVDRYIPLHTKQIRGLCFNPAKNDLLLSVGMDRIAKITNVCSNSLVLSFVTDVPLWCCCWNLDITTQFFVGTASGCVLIYDIRDTTSSENVIDLSGSGPVVSLVYVPFSNSSMSFSSAGLLVARLQKLSFIEIKENITKEHILEIEGPFTSISFENETRHLLVSCRPSYKCPHARHVVCELQNVHINDNEKVVSLNIIHTFKGGTMQKLLSRSFLIKCPIEPYPIYVLASDESMQSTFVWDIKSLNCIQQIKNNETVIDILPIISNHVSYISLLTEKSIKMYKWVNI